MFWIHASLANVYERGLWCPGIVQINADLYSFGKSRAPIQYKDDILPA